MDVDMSRGNGADRVIVSANAPTMDLCDYWEQTYDGFGRLDVLASARGIMQAAISDAVAEARSAGRSWDAIGAELGMTRQGAQQRYGS